MNRESEQEVGDLLKRWEKKWKKKKNDQKKRKNEKELCRESKHLSDLKKKTVAACRIKSLYQTGKQY